MANENGSLLAKLKRAQRLERAILGILLVATEHASPKRIRAAVWDLALEAAFGPPSETAQDMPATKARQRATPRRTPPPVKELSVYETKAYGRYVDENR